MTDDGYPPRALMTCMLLNSHTPQRPPGYTALLGAKAYQEPRRSLVAALDHICRAELAPEAQAALQSFDHWCESRNETERAVHKRALHDATTQLHEAAKRLIADTPFGRMEQQARHLTDDAAYAEEMTAAFVSERSALECRRIREATRLASAISLCVESGQMHLWVLFARAHDSEMKLRFLDAKLGDHLRTSMKRRDADRKRRPAKNQTRRTGKRDAQRKKAEKIWADYASLSPRPPALRYAKHKAGDWNLSADAIRAILAKGTASERAAVHKTSRTE